MSALPAWYQSIASLSADSIVCLLIAKSTVLLTMAWLAHGLLAGANPRWRVALWRATLASIVLLPVFSWAPPIVEYRLPQAGVAEGVHFQSASIDPYRRPFALGATTPERQGRGQPGHPVPGEATESWPRTGANRAATADVLAAQSNEAIDRASRASDLRRITARAEGVSGSRGVAIPRPAPAESLTSRLRFLAAWCGGAIWLSGAFILTVRIIIGWLSLIRLVRRSIAVPDGIDHECRELARLLGCRRAIPVRLTAELSSPCLAGTVRPAILLPQWTCRDAPDRLRAILAHELAHARNHDLAWNLGARAVSILLWFHPLIWRLSAAHATACDGVCDAVAVDLLGDAVSYGKTLARLALRAARTSPTCGLAMARTSDVRRRIEALNRSGLATPLTWGRVLPALVAGSAIVLVIGGFRLTRAGNPTPAPHPIDDQADSVPKPQAGDHAKPASQTSSAKAKQAFHAVATETGRPIEGVSIEYSGRFDAKEQKGTVVTGKDGIATIEYPAAAHIAYFYLTARKPNFVPVQLSLNDRLRPVDLAIISELRFESGTTIIGGIVKDEAGHPIEGATINVYGRAKQEADWGSISFQEIKTDAQGRWRLNFAPRDLAGVSVNVTHPRYRLNGAQASRDLESTIVLIQGPSVSGRVIDSAGRPVKGAEVGFGYDHFNVNAPIGTTNERGEFIIENCERGASIVTVQAEGFAPQIANVVANERTRPIEIKLTEPGSVLRVKVVDVDGKPVVGAFFGANTWRGHRSLRFYRKSDKNGRIQWSSAPRDAVLYGTGHFGYMSKRWAELIAEGREHVITLSPELAITGRVTDAQTGRPLPKFRLIRTNGILGSQRAPLHDRWARHEAIEITGGRYTTRFSEPAEPFYLRVEADGYLPAESRGFKATEGNQTFDFALRRSQKQLTVTVLLPGGKPAGDAEVLVNTDETGWLMEGGHFDSRVNVLRIKAGSDGRFSFTPPDDPYILIVISDAGYAHAWPDDFAKTRSLVLQPWGKIEGELRVGRQPAANQQVEFYPAPIQRGGKSYRLNYLYRALTDKQGRFALDRVVPVAGDVSRYLPCPVGGFPAWGWQEHALVKPGQTARVNIGGKGRPVVGRIVLDGARQTTVDWTKNQPVMIRVPLRETKDSLTWRCFGSYIDKDGRFRVDDVPPGKYDLEVIVNSDAYPKVRGDEAVIGRLNTTITVPDAPNAQPDESVDLGAITIRLFETLKAGDIAPDFTVPRIAGKGRGDTLKLGDYRGKLILLDFWATWCGPCRAEMPAIKDIQNTFGGDTRFQMISLSLDDKAESALTYIKENGLIWTHGFTGNSLGGASASNAYRVRSIPATFLIGPDGLILAKDLRGSELKEAVRKALEDRKLFPAQNGATPKP
jgi:beta-lactamase regulating signal transducer with metallopeptidase domain/thiol-disulfide isomerase/thioredoxin/protocatechuate 3,4-dioxygenase beta subunit